MLDTVGLPVVTTSDLAPFDNANIIFFYTKQATLMGGQLLLAFSEYSLDNLFMCPEQATLGTLITLVTYLCVLLHLQKNKLECLPMTSLFRLG